MKKRVGILTSGGDCPGLNATIRGVAKALYARMGDNVEIVGILNGYSGLINGDYKEMCEDDFRGILTLGGTILGTKRTPFKMMRVVEDDNIDKVAAMKKTYKEAKLDCLLCLGGNGTHKTANLLSQEGLNIIGLPKTIDNDIYGTDVTFGFHTAVDIATDVIDRIHTTAGSHSRVMCIEIMGNKAGWLTLYSGIAGGADIILLPELPYDIDRVCEAVERRAKKGSNFSILAVAEGAINTEEARMKRKDWMAKRAEAGLGTTAIAANSLGVSAESLCYMAGYGIQDASLALVGQAVGANRRDMAKNFAWLCTGMGIGIMALTGVGMYIFAPNLMGIFTADAAVIALGAQVLRIEALAEPMFGASIVASGAMQGAGDSTGCFVLNLVSMWGIRLTLASLLAPHFGLVGVWMAMSFELTMRGVLFLVRLVRGRWLDKGALA